jgi:hypothetical protein
MFTIHPTQGLWIGSRLNGIACCGPRCITSGLRDRRRGPLALAAILQSLPKIIGHPPMVQGQDGTFSSPFLAPPPGLDQELA